MFDSIQIFSEIFFLQIDSRPLCLSGIVLDRIAFDFAVTPKLSKSHKLK
jgi:hypothetical protein